MRRALLAPGLALLGLAPVPAAHAGLPECCAALKKALEEAAPRRGVSCRWLAVVPLVRAGAAAGGAPTGPLLSDEGLAWARSPRTEVPYLVSLRPPAAPPLARLVPSGVVLEGDADERLTCTPTLLPDGKPVLMRSVPLPPTPRAPAAGDGGGPVGPLSPIEFRRSAFVGAEPADLRDLLLIEACLVARAPGKDRVALADLAASAPDRVGPAVAALRRLADAYGGDVVGHAVFLGNRLVEVVLAASPATYRSVLTAEQGAIGFSMVAWEELYGRDGPLVPEIDWGATLKETERVVRALGDPSIRPEKRDEPRPAAGDAWRVKATMRPGRVPTEVGWLLSDPAGRATWFEAWPEAASGPLPPPSPAPGAVPPDEDGEDRKHGGMGVPYLERKIRQLEELDTTGAMVPRIQSLKKALASLLERRGRK